MATQAYRDEALKITFGKYSYPPNSLFYRLVIADRRVGWRNLSMESLLTRRTQPVDLLPDAGSGAELPTAAKFIVG
jgi:hypothetical protein